MSVSIVVVRVRIRKSFDLQKLSALFFFKIIFPTAKDHAQFFFCDIPLVQPIT